MSSEKIARRDHWELFEGPTQYPPSVSPWCHEEAAKTIWTANICFADHPFTIVKAMPWGLLSWHKSEPCPRPPATIIPELCVFKNLGLRERRGCLAAYLLSFRSQKWAFIFRQKTDVASFTRDNAFSPNNALSCMKVYGNHQMMCFIQNCINFVWWTKPELLKRFKCIWKFKIWDLQSAPFFL